MCPVHDPNSPSFLVAAFKAEPARGVALTLALIGVATSFGLGITDGQQAAIVALVSAVLAMVGGETVRSQVTPTSKLEESSPPVVAHDYADFVRQVKSRHASLDGVPRDTPDTPPAKKAAPVKKAAAKRPAKKAAPKSDGLS